MCKWYKNDCKTYLDILIILANWILSYFYGMFSICICVTPAAEAKPYPSATHGVLTANGNTYRYTESLRVSLTVCDTLSVRGIYGYTAAVFLRDSQTPGTPRAAPLNGINILPGTGTSHMMWDWKFSRSFIYKARR